MATQHKFDATKQFNAAVGAGDLAVERLLKVATDLQTRLDDARANGVGETKAQLTSRLDTLTKEAKEAQTRLEARFAGLQSELGLSELQSELKTLPKRIETLVAELQADAKELPARAQTRVAELQDEAKSLLAMLATRGESRIAKLRDDSISGDVEIIDETETAVKDVAPDVELHAAAAAQAAEAAAAIKPPTEPSA